MVSPPWHSKQAGFDKRIATSVIKNGNDEVRTLEEESAKLGKSRDDYIHQVKNSLGIRDLEKEVERLRHEKEARVRSFDSEPFVLERKGRHREVWLSARRK